MNRQILFGPPGTGKTTSLLAIVKQKIREGLTPDQICFIAFTRRAAHEALDRASVALKVDADMLPWFRTLHSMAFQQLSMNKANVMGLGDYIKLCESLGLSITYKNYAEDGTFAGQTKGDRLLFTENMSRARMLPLKDHWETMPNEDINFFELERLARALQEYKNAHQKVDFTDIIHRFVENPIIPPCEVIIVDEAQDLSPLQWTMVEKLMQHIPEQYIAGDDDQAIFRWAGADVDKLINLPGEQTVLGHSYRVPRKVQEVALEIVKQISVRVEKEWSPREEDGSVEHVMSIEQVDLSQGTWLLLARNAYLLDTYVQHCLREGVMFDAPGQASRGESLQAIDAWERLRKGEQVYASHVKKIYDLMSVRVGVSYGFKGKINDLPDKKLVTLKELRESWGLCVESPWDQAFDKMNSQEKEYFLAAQRRGEQLSGQARIRISTMHGAKGAEAENVVVQSDMAYRTFNEMQEHPDDEHRVWYVAVTRAKQRLIIIQPQTNLCYPL